MKHVQGFRMLLGSFLALLMMVSLGREGFSQTTYTVTNTDDSGTGSLRQAIIDAEASGGVDLIDATAISGTITLLSGLPVITQDVSINGSGKSSLYISGDNVVRPFFITGGTVSFNDLTIMNGLSQGGSPAVGGGGGAGMGGGVYVDAGTVTFNGVAFTGNSAKGGNSNGDPSYGYGTAGGDGPFSNSGGSGGAASTYTGLNGGNGTFGGGGGSGGYGAYAGGYGGNGGYGGGAGAVGSKYDGTSGAGDFRNPGTPGEFGGSSSGSNFGGNDTYRRSGGGGAGLGGALFARSGSTVNILNCTFSNNSAVKGTGNSGYGGTNGKGKGGAIFVHTGAIVVADGISFNGNSADDETASDNDNDDSYGALLNYAPKVKISSATLLSATAATLNGSADKNGYSTTYKFQYSTSSDLSGYLETSTGNVPAPPAPTVNDGNALSLNESGSGAYVSIPDNGTLDLFDRFTIEAWIYQTDNVNNTIIDKGDYQYLFQVNNGVLGFYSASGTYGAWRYSSGTTVPVNKWTHVAVTFDGYANSIIFYINSTAAGSGSAPNLLSTPDNGDVNIGRQQPSNCGCNTFNGNIDELKIWSTVRTPSQIAANYKSILTGSESGLSAYYHFDETSGTTVTDATSNGNNGTIQGSGSLVDSDWYPPSTYAPVSKAITGLTPGTKYYFRLSATNTKGTTVSDISNFIYSPKISDLALWLLADSSLTVDGNNKVSEWIDLSPNKGGANQGNVANQPTLVTNVLNGHSVVRFDGSSSFLSTNTVDVGNEMTIVSVTKASVNTDDWQRVISDNAYFLFGYYAGNINNYYGNGAWASNGAVGVANIGSFEIKTTTMSNTADNTYLNGVALTAVNITRSSHSSPLIIGAAWENSAYAQFLNGDIAELIIYNKILSETERQAIESKLMLKYQVGAKSTASNPSVPSGGTGNYVLGSTGASVNFTTGSETSGTLDATVSDNPVTAGELPITVSGVNSQKYWSIQNSGLTGITYSITLDLSDVTEIADFRALRILKRENADSVWKDVEFAPFNATVIYDEPFITISGLTNFSEFGFGEFSGVLPVELLSFKGSISGTKVSLNWATATESNNYGFEIERRIQNSDWTTVGFVSGKGTTTEKQSYTFSDKLNLVSSLVQYRLKQIDVNGKFEYSNVLSLDTKPLVLELAQNYPNPFNPSTHISFTVPSKGFVSVKIFDMLGREVKSLKNEEMEVGKYSVTFTGSEFASGIYFCKLAFNGQIVTRKLTLLK